MQACQAPGHVNSNFMFYIEFVQLASTRREASTVAGAPVGTWWRTTGPLFNTYMYEDGPAVQCLLGMSPQQIPARYRVNAAWRGRCELTADHHDETQADPTGAMPCYREM